MFIICGVSVHLIYCTRSVASFPPPSPPAEMSGESDVITRAAEAADELYTVRDTFFPKDPSERAAKIQSLAHAALSLLDSLPQNSGNHRHNVQFMNFSEEKYWMHFLIIGKKQKIILSKAVKLNPSLADAWLCLGNCIWKKGDLPSAKNCFSLAPSKGPNKKILCQLSMLERRMAQGTDNEAQIVEDSILHAKEAVMLDIKDGNSWYNLGNACLTSFFMTGAWDHSKLQRSLKAYQNAEKDETMKSNPDLFFNCATANKYLENYERSLRGFEAAALKDPGLNADREVQKIITLLDKLENSVKGQARPKRLASLISSLAGANLKSSHTKVMVNLLAEGLNKTVAIVGKVLLFIKHDNVAPLYYLACDKDQTLFILSVYGLHSDAIKEGDRVAVLEPYHRMIDFRWNGKHYEFKSIRVDFVEQILVNEKVPAPHHAIRASIRAQHKP